MPAITIRIAKHAILLLFAALPAMILNARAQPGTPTGERTHAALLSPDKQTRFELSAGPEGLRYRISYHDRLIIDGGKLGLVINGRSAGSGTFITSGTSSAHRGSFSWRLGENAVVPDHYNQLTVSCRSHDLHFNLVVRAFDGSIAFRYQLPLQPSLKNGRITKELTSFVFYKPLTIYQYNQESVFAPTDMDSLNKSCDLPATLTDYQHTYISIGEADNEDFTKAELTRGNVAHSLELSFRHDSAVQVSGAFETPWRTVSIANTAVGLHDYSALYLKLVKPGAASIPQWIKPGKLIRAQLSTESGLRCVDFAAKHHFQYVLFDAGWYGKEFNSISDPRAWIPSVDIPRIIRYGKSKQIGIILYVNYAGLRKYLDQLIPLYKKWGVAGMKFGFVDALTQSGITWLMSAVRKAGDAGLVIDIHDNYKPTGLSRKYPALLTQEGVRGDEHGPDAFHTTVLPFTRFLAGPADFTFCYPNSANSFSRNLKVSMAQQLALSVIYFSPLQSIFWYGKPEDYTNEQEIAFFTDVPTVWDESHYLAGEIGKYISVARRKGNTWFIGNAAGMEDWSDTLKLDFLSPRRTYRAVIYEDDPQGGIQKKLLTVKDGDLFPLHIRARGGQAVMLTPVQH